MVTFIKSVNVISDQISLSLLVQYAVPRGMQSKFDDFLSRGRGCMHSEPVYRCHCTATDAFYATRDEDHGSLNGVASHHDVSSLQFSAILKESMSRSR